MNKIRRVNIYLYIVLAVSLIYYVICFFTRGKYFDSIFFGDINDTFADFFNSLYKNGEQYNVQITNYPGLATLLFKRLYHFLPVETNVNKGLDFRSYSYAWIVFILFNGITIWISTFSISRIIKKSSINSYLLSAVLFLSPIVMYSIERNNLVNFAFACTLFYIAFYDDDRMLIRNLSYILLAVAAGTKIYPAIYGLILVKDKKWKDSLILLFYGLFMFFAPFLLLGHNSFNNFISGMTAFVGNLHDVYGYGYNFSLKNLNDISKLFLHVGLSDKSFTTVLLLIITFLLLLFFYSQSKWESLFFLTLCLIWAPSISFMYVNLFLIIPFLSFLVESDKEGRINIVPAFLFAILFIPFASPLIPEMSFGGSLLSYSYLIYFIALFVFGLYEIMLTAIILARDLITSRRKS